MLVKVYGEKVFTLQNKWIFLSKIMHTIRTDFQNNFYYVGCRLVDIKLYSTIMSNMLI